MKYNIVALIEGNPKGFIRSISYDKGKFAITKEKNNARKFSDNEVFDEIDTLTAFGYNKGYVFMYVPA